MDRRYAIAIATIAVVFACWWLAPTNAAILLVNTGCLALAILLLAVPVAASLAYCLTKCRILGQGLCEAGLLLLLFLPLYIQLASWEAGFGTGGWYSMVIAQKLSNPPLDGFRGAVLVHAVALVPWLFWIFRLGLIQVPRTLEQAALLEATPGQVLRTIILPLSMPALVAGALYVLVVVSTEITVTDRYQVRTYAEVLYNEFVLNTSFDALPLSMAPIVALMTTVTACGLAICGLLPGAVHATIDRVTTRDRPTNWWASSYVIGIVSLLLLLPVGNLLYQAGIEVRSVDDQLVRTWSIEKLMRIVASSPIKYQQELAWTAVLAQLSVGASVFCATLIAWWARRRALRQFCAATVGTLCFVTPGPFIGLGIIWALNSRSSSFLTWLYDDTLFAPWLAITIRCFPVAYVIIWFGIQAIPQTFFEAAASDGASSVACLRHIAIPMLMPSLVGAALVCSAVSIGELSASVLIMPAGVTTVATEVFRLIHYGAEDQLAGLCLSCLLAIVTISLLARLALGKLAATATLRSGA